MKQIFKIPNFLKGEEANVIYARILQTEDHIKSLGPPRYDGVEGDSLTGRFMYYNSLQDEVLGPLLKPKLKVCFGRRRFFQVWANTFRKGDRIKPHRHQDPNDGSAQIPHWTCANIFIGGEASEGTYYDGVLYPNRVGELTVFQSDIPHWTNPYQGDDVRVTMAMDIHLNKMNPSQIKIS